MLKTAASKSTTIKVLASTVLVAGAVGVAGLGTFGAFTSTTTATQAVGSGTIELSLNGAAEATERFGAVSGMVPGDTFARNVNLARGADDEAFGSLIIKPTARTTTAADAQLVKQLSATVQACSVPWTITGTTLACGTASAPGTVTDLATVADLMQGVTLDTDALSTNLNGTSRQLNLGVVFSFDSSGDDAADNLLQNASADLSFTFTATQRAGTSL